MYLVNWDNGNGSSGTFPHEFGTESAAEAFGAAWVAEMQANDSDDDSDPCGDRTYSYEVIERGP